MGEPTFSRNKIDLPIQDIDTKEEAIKLRKKVDAALKELEASVVYANVKRQLKNCAELGRNIARVLSYSNYSSLQVVIYGLGSLELCRVAKYQLSIVLLLRRDFPDVFESIQLFDPRFTNTDISVLNELECEVLLIDEQCRRKSERPTLFFMPAIRIDYIGALLGSNWCPGLINQMILLTYSLSDLVGIHLKQYKEFKSNWKYFNGPLHTKEFNKELQEYMDEMGGIKAYGEAIEPFKKEIRIKRVPEKGIPEKDKYKSHLLLYDYAWHFFKVDPQVNMMTLLHGKLSKEMVLAYFMPFEPLPCNSAKYLKNKSVLTREEREGILLYYNDSTREDDDDDDDDDVMAN